jgi:dihydropteroate synthase
MPLSLDDILASHRTATPVVMGILNITPDSFSDGGAFASPETAVTQARTLAADGADILDIGAESTRPGSERIPAAAQIARLREILPAIRETLPHAILSIDTTRAAVARFALDAGVSILNDISAGRDDPDLLALAGERNAPVILMHMLGEPGTMQNAPHYHNVAEEVCAFLTARRQAALDAGVAMDRCILDPGIGFGKTLAANLTLLQHTARLAALGSPVLVGPSRKRFIGEVTHEPLATRRLGGTIAACVAAYARGATLFRVHDVRETRDALTLAQAIRSA